MRAAFGVQSAGGARKPMWVYVYHRRDQHMWLATVVALSGPVSVCQRLSDVQQALAGR